MSQEALLISRSEIESLVTMSDILRTTEDVFTSHGTGNVRMPSKITLDLSASGEPNWMNAMPAYVPHLEAGGIKWAGGFLHNRKRRGLDYVQASIILNNPITGEITAVMDGAWITNARTGAVPALVHKHLGVQPSPRVALIGAGMQARWTLRALLTQGELEDIRVFDIRRQSAEEFAAEMGDELEIEIQVVDGAEEAVSAANLVVTVTTANEPLVRAEWVSQSTVVVSMGSYQELDDQLILEADLRVVDHREQNRHRGEFKRLFDSGDLTPRMIAAEFGEIVAGTKPGRTTTEQTVVASMIGVASVDIAIAQLVLDRAREQGSRNYFDFC